MSMYRLFAAGFLAVATAAAPRAEAQNPQRAVQLRRDLERRFAEQVRTQLALTDSQAVRVREVMSRYAMHRGDLEAKERELRRALGFQLRPGVAAEADSVGRLVDGITALRVEYMQLMQAEMRDLSGVLTNVQRGQLFLMRDRILQRVQELRQQRQGVGAGPPPPGAGPPPVDGMP